MPPAGLAEVFCDDAASGGRRIPLLLKGGAISAIIPPANTAPNQARRSIAASSGTALQHGVTNAEINPQLRMWRA